MAVDIVLALALVLMASGALLVVAGFVMGSVRRGQAKGRGIASMAPAEAPVGVAKVIPPVGRDIVSVIVLLHVVALGVLVWLYVLASL